MSDTPNNAEEALLDANLEIRRLRHELGVAEAQVCMAKEELRTRMHDLARELRVPLASLLGFIDLLSATCTTNSNEISQIAIAGQQLKDIVRNMELLAAGEEPALEQIAVEPDLPPIPPTSEMRSILHVEDNEGNYRLVENILEDRANIALYWATSGKKGFEIACKRTPDLVLLDLNLPDMHGSYLLSRLRNNTRTRNIPVVVLSAEAKPDQVEKLKEAGAQYYMVKPFDVKQLLSVVDHVFAPAA